MDKVLTIKESRLKELLEAYHILMALEQGGVDNWEWYGDSRQDYIDCWVEETKRDKEIYWDFEDIVKEELLDYN